MKQRRGVVVNPWWWRHRGILVVLLIGGEPMAAHAVTPQVDCYGSLKAYSYDKNLKHLNCYCPSPTSTPVCTGAGASSVPRSGGSRSKSYDPTMDLMQGIMNGIMNPPKQPSGNAAALRAQQEALEKQRQEREMREAMEQAQRDASFRQDQTDTLGSLKDGSAPSAPGLRIDATDSLGLKPVPPPAAPAGRPSSTLAALRELNCSAHWALAAARHAGAGRLAEARLDGERAAQAHGARAGGCPEVVVDVPGVSGAAATDRYRQIVQQAQQLQTLFTRNHQALSETRAKRDKVRQELDRAKEKGRGATDAQDDEALRKAREVERAQQKLMRELEQLEQAIGRTETEQQRLQGQLDGLERNYQAMARQP
jgi:hypothetical protein